MSTALQKTQALHLYETGVALYEEHRYQEALVELEGAEQAFRAMDARGHAFTHALANGITGLSNTLAYEGLCHQHLGRPLAAVHCFESSFINSRFERKRRLKTFTATVERNLLECYERLREQLHPDALTFLLETPADIDTSCRFPFSLPSEAIILARLYELAPERYASYRDFYRSAQERDEDRRKHEKRTDAASLRTRSIIVWGALIIIWTLYGYIAVEALLTAP
jgi:hypothetical protein